MTNILIKYLTGELRNEIVDELARKIRILKAGFPEDLNESVVIVSPYNLGETVIGFKHVYVPTLGDIRLAECEPFLAREFENL